MMTPHTLTIRTRNDAVAVERLLQVTRYRGFQLVGMQLREEADQQGMVIELQVQSERPLSLLTGQLAKLYDVLQLDVHEVQAQLRA